MKMRLWRRHRSISVTLVLCVLVLNSRAETAADASLDSHDEIQSPPPLPKPESGSDTAALFTLLETGSVYSSQDSPTPNLAVNGENAAVVEQADDIVSAVEYPATDSQIVIQLPGIDSRTDDMGAILRAASLLENAGTGFDIEAPIAMDQHLLQISLSHADILDNTLTELASADTEMIAAIALTLPRADLMTVDTDHIEFTIPTRAASASATAIPLARAVNHPEARQSATLANMAAITEYKESDISVAVTSTQKTTISPSVKTTAAPETVQADFESPPLPASPPPLSFQPEHLKRDPKTLKERFNYASSDCAAVVLKANREARGLTSILNSKKDMYMLNECSARSKFVIVELCDDILVDTLVMGNYEFFSSTFRDTMVYVSDRYPPKENSTWTLLGHFQAHNSRDAQVFPVIDPKIWARYLKVEFLTHYGHEFYCPLTVLKVYGATQMEQYRKEEEEDGGDFMDTATLTVDVLMGTPALDYQLRFPYHKQPPSQLRIGEAASPAKAYLRDMQGLVDGYVARDEGEPLSASTAAASAAAPMPKVPNLPWGQGNADEGDDDEDEDDVDEGDDDEEEDDESEAGFLGDQLSDTTSEPSVGSDDGGKLSVAADATLFVGDDGQVYRPEDGDNRAAGVDHAASERLRQQQLLQQQNLNGGADRAKRGQESIFKTIMRRLARVERNVTLAYHYLEEQHMVFNLVLQQVEMNNLENMQLAIKQLNHSTAKQMQSLTALSEEVWRAILYDLEAYQQSTRTEMGEMARKLEFLAEEVLFEKRMNVAQLVLLLTIVVMVAVNKVATKLALIPESKKEK
ncbi:hypothetical protein GGI19_005031 [Coemansia pectinata]|uniref:SUN domain-containing protein n=1 Tax=Coemansia pectinata TaxID=1052879 RepID=A0A9W8GT05_9FUNG|nr:hypothetical protein GGI19_005031 [Coemansia pectinata]